MWHENWSTAARETSPEVYANVSNLQHIKENKKTDSKKV
jgi:hypothetical protein